MKHFALIVAGALLVGCSQERPAPVANSGSTPGPTAAPAPTPAVTPAPAAAPVVALPAPEPAKVIPVYELTQDSKTYVFATVEALTEFTNGKAQPTIVQKPDGAIGRRSVIIEAADAAQAEEVLAGYNKLHPVGK